VTNRFLPPSRGTLSLALFLLSSLAFAGDPLGLKADPISAPASTGGVGLGPMLQMLVALGIVLLLLKTVMPKVLKKFGKKLVTKLDGGIQIEESANFPGGTLYVVKARKRTLLISVAASGVTSLADLTEPDPLENEPTFQELVEEVEPFAVVDPLPRSLAHGPSPYRAQDIAPEGGDGDPQLALERLRRLAG